MTQPTPIHLYLFELALLEDGTPVPGYLVQTSEGKNILIDTGYPMDASFLARERPAGRRFLHVTPASEQLAKVGLAPHDIHFLVCTHFDLDHCGGHDAFASAELIAQRTAYDFARGAEDERWTLARPHWDHPHLRYRLIDGDLELVPGVELLEISGHVPGHQAVLVRLPKSGPVLLAIDAVTKEIDLDPETREDLPADVDHALARSSARKLSTLIKREGVALTVFGHDAKLWPSLKKAPTCYE